tara:strand:+ start:4553 stop:5428 length:876 start_codon:yes stop_codon:yes gene_type:complete
MFDVVIPVYKTEPDYLREAIDSVLNQSYPHFQIYISDGTPEGHEWHSTKTLADYDDERIHIIQQEGKGIADARNQAGKMGSNPYIATLDSDDTWFELKLEYYKQLFEENPSLSIIWGEAQVSAEITSVKGETRTITSFGGICQGWSQTLPQHRWFRVCWNPLMTSTQVYSRKIIESVGWWNPTLTMGEDTDLNIRILKEYPDAHQVEACVGTYRVHSTQTTKGGESHGIESGILTMGRPDTFDRMFQDLKEKEEGIGEEYWNWLYETVNSTRQADIGETLEFSLRGGRRFV